MTVLDSSIWLLCRIVQSYDQHGDPGMVHDVGADAAHHRPAQGAAAPRSGDNHIDVLLIGLRQDRLARPLA